jgi:hypothetical protein
MKLEPETWSSSINRTKSRSKACTFPLPLLRPQLRSRYVVCAAHLRLVNLISSCWKDHESYFYEGLNHWRELNLSLAFTTFARKADGLSASMPLLLHHWNDIVDLWITAVKSADDEATSPLLEYKLCSSIRLPLLTFL